MRIRIISGNLGGRMIDTPPGRTTHPMGDRVRMALFNMIAKELSGAVVLDAFAGTGALGFESLSRGALRVTFVEKDRVASKILRENATQLAVLGRAQLVQAPVASWVSTQGDGAVFDIIFADPPYHHPQLATVRSLSRLLKPGGVMVLSHPENTVLETPSDTQRYDTRSYAGANLSFYRKVIHST